MSFPGSAQRQQLPARRASAGRAREGAVLYLLDGLELRYGAQRVVVPYGSQRLLAFLALRDRPVKRSFVSGCLWPDTTEERAAACLRSAMWRAPSPEGRPLVDGTTTHLRLGPAIRVDYHEVVAWATALVSGHADTGTASGPAMATISQELLPDWDDDEAGRLGADGLNGLEPRDLLHVDAWG